MSIFKKFDKTDVVNVSLGVSPKFSFTSGTAGWRGNFGVSSSISLLDGIRKNQPTANISIKPIFKYDSYTIDGEIQTTGSYPAYASIKLVKVSNDETISSVPTRWGARYFQTICGLYDWHSNYNTGYHTGSYDYYSLFFRRSDQNIVSRSGSVSYQQLDTISSSFTMEFWIKPFSTSSITDDFTIASRNRVFYLGLTGSTGQLVFSGSFIGIVTSSFAPSINRWHHVVVRGASNTGSFLIDLVDAGNFTYTGSMARPATFFPSLTIGNVYSSPTSQGGNVESGSIASVGFTNRSFHGFIHEARLWSTMRTDQQISASFNRTLIDSSSAGLVSYYRFNQGPLFYRNEPFLDSVGSGVLDHTAYSAHMALGTFTRLSPIWQPNDNNLFYTSKTLSYGTPSNFKVVNIPSIFYGSQITTGSVELTCRSYSADGLAVIRILNDDGKGNLYVSGSMCSSSVENKESYRGAGWNKVGNVFYGEGLIVITDQSMLDFGEDRVISVSAQPNEILSVEFMADNTIPSRKISCRLESSEFNFSQNSSFTEEDSTGRRWAILQDPVTYITGIGLYNKDHKLVGIAKLASPLRKREKDKINIRLKLDF